jgi:hypothetical protein
MTSMIRVTTVVVACIGVGATTAAADQWNDRTTLTFSAPVMIPGATLPAGKYVFELADAAGNRNLVRVVNETTGMVIAMPQAIPITRPEPSGDVVLQFNPTEPGVAPAMKAWFYPASRYGHEFVYPEEQARHIAERTKTVVLSVDVPGSDLERGVLHSVDATGRRAEWRGDPATMKEWETWQQGRAAADRDERAKASAPAVTARFEGTRVTLDDLEDNPKKYIGQRISVDAEVEDVYGPRLFTIDEPNWGDLDGEILVLMPTPLAAIVKEDDRVTISGTMKPFVRTDIEREWGWLGLDPEVEVDVSAKPVLVAERLIGGTSNVAMVIDTTPRREHPVGTSGANALVTDPATIARSDERLVGRQVDLGGLEVTGMASSGGGFFVGVGDRQVFVLPANQLTTVKTGDTVGVYGVVLRMPRDMAERLQNRQGLNEDVYVYAPTIVTGGGQ